MKPLLGGKGANLAEMRRIGLPVPPGFTITTEVCTYYYAHKRTYPASLRGQMQAGIAAIEQQKILAGIQLALNRLAVDLQRQAIFSTTRLGHQSAPNPKQYKCPTVRT